MERHGQDGELTGMALVCPLCYVHVLEVRGRVRTWPEDVPRCAAYVQEQWGAQSSQVPGLTSALVLPCMARLQGKTPQLMSFLRDVLSHPGDLRLAETRVSSSTCRHVCRRAADEPHTFTCIYQCAP